MEPPTFFKVKVNDDHCEYQTGQSVWLDLEKPLGKSVLISPLLQGAGLTIIVAEGMKIEAPIWSGFIDIATPHFYYGHRHHTVDIRSNLQLRHFCLTLMGSYPKLVFPHDPRIETKVFLLQPLPPDFHGGGAQASDLSPGAGVRRGVQPFWGTSMENSKKGWASVINYQLPG